MVSCQQTVSLGHGMRSDEKVRDYAPSIPALSMILPPHFPCQSCRCQVNGRKNNRKVSQCVFKGLLRGKEGSELGPYHIACHNPTFLSAAPKSVQRGRTKMGIRTKNVNQHIGIYRRDQGYPLISAMISSVLFSRERHP